MMEARGHIDVLVPRGGAGLIQAVVRNSKVPVIETGAGNVHIYIDKSGDLAKAIPIIINATTQRVAEVRRLYQPDFPLPTFAEIRRVVQDEWDEDMGKIDPKEDNPSAGEIEEETESADDAAGEGGQA